MTGDVPRVRAASHALFTSADVPRIMRFVEGVLGVRPNFENEDFGEVILPSGFRVAFFRAKGKAADFFSEGDESGRRAFALGVTVDDVDAVHEVAVARGARVSGPPKDHPWGERSFLLIDPDGNRWEVAQSVRTDGMLPDRGLRGEEGDARTSS